MECHTDTVGAGLQRRCLEEIQGMTTFLHVQPKPSLTEKVKKFALNFGPFLLAGAAAGAVMYTKGYGMQSLPSWINGSTPVPTTTPTPTTPVKPAAEFFAPPVCEVPTAAV